MQDKALNFDLEESKKAADAWYWAYKSEVRLQGGPFQLIGHEYLADVMSCEFQRQCAMKGAQLGFTEAMVLKTVHGHIYGKYPKGTLYLFPSKDDVTDFSKGRFSTLISDNPETIASHVTDTDAAHIKRIGTGMLYLRGARVGKKLEGIVKSSSRLKSVPVDAVRLDERDEIDDAMINLAKNRLDHSEVKDYFSLSTPSVPDFGIDKEYKTSDQRVWMLECEACGKETCLELEFPECIHVDRDGHGKRVCIHCRQEIFPWRGRWVPLAPTRSKDLIGWWISQLNSVYVDPGEIVYLMDNPPDGDITNVYHSKLGRAYIEAENRLTKNDVLACCGLDPIAREGSDWVCAMGVDVGSVDLHVVIGFRPSDKKYQIVYAGRVPNFNDVHDLASLFGVRSAVIDAQPETRKVREFQKAENYPIWLCYYHESLKIDKKEDHEKGTLTVHRTETCDATHHMFQGPGVTQIPRRSAEIEVFAEQVSNMAKVPIEDPMTGTRIYRYKTLGPDHYRHACNYFWLACKEPEVQNAWNRTETRDKRNLKPTQAIIDYDPLTYHLGKQQ